MNLSEIHSLANIPTDLGFDRPVSFDARKLTIAKWLAKLHEANKMIQSVPKEQRESNKAICAASSWVMREIQVWSSIASQRNFPNWRHLVNQNS